MTRGIELSTLSSLSDDATLAALSTILSAEHNTHRSGRRSLVNNLLLGVKDAETLYAGSGEPTDKPQGKLFFDTATSLWKGYKTASGTPVSLLESALVYTVDMATAGTATFRVGGPLSSGVNTTDSARTTTGDFTAYTLPAGTLARNGQHVKVLFFGTRTGAAGTFSLQPIFGTSNMGTAFASTIDSLTAWVVVLVIVRVNATAQDYAWYVCPNSDATGSVTLAAVGGVNETLSGALEIKINLSAIGAGTVTQGGFIVDFGNY